MEMGTGKTKVAIDWAGIGFHNFGVRKVLVVAPLSVLSVWPRQIRQHSPVSNRALKLTGSTINRVRLLKLLMKNPDDSKVTWVIINYEGIWRSPDRGYGVEQLLIKWAPDIVIFDESHRIKSHSSKQSRAAWRIARTVPMRLLLSGTPITKAPLDLFGQFRALDSSIFGTKWTDFRRRYALFVGPGQIKYILRAYLNLDELIGIVKKWTFRIKKSQCLDLPPKVYLPVPVTLSAKAVNLYKEMANEMIIEIEETHATASIVLTKMLRLRTIASGFVKDVEGKIRIFDDSKLLACLDLLEDLIEEDHKVVVFFRFTADLARIDEALDKRGIKHLILSGSVPESRRDSIRDQFQNDPDSLWPVFLIQIQTGSEGIELFAADAAIYYTIDHNALHYWQSQDRLHRPGQKSSKVTYYQLIAEPVPIDRITYQALDHKTNLAEAVLHNPRVLLNGISTLDR